MNGDTRKKITVEDLIRLKRAERPPADFWTKFDSQMRAKQLSAIVARRPWWDGLHRRAFTIVVRHPMPIGAAAALALTWAGVRYSSEPLHASRVVIAANSGTQGLQAAARRPAPLEASSQPSAARAAETVSAPRQEAHASKPVIDATAPHISRPPVDISASAASLSPFSEGISVTMADFREQSPEIARRSVFGTDGDFEPAVSQPSQTRQVASEPLARLDPAAERRARLLAPALPAAKSAASSDWIRERTASDDRIYESMDRASSDRMLTGFRF